MEISALLLAKVYEQKKRILILAVYGNPHTPSAIAFHNYDVNRLTENWRFDYMYRPRGGINQTIHVHEVIE